MGFSNLINGAKGIRLIEPVGYLDFMKLLANAAVVMTDSGGIQEETTILQVPCMTLRENTERPVTITEGTNQLVHVTTKDILEKYQALKSKGFVATTNVPQLWDGKASERIVGRLVSVSDEDLKYGN
jgi:UDP-N-acetylglucosamine 2-epimerase (non-hydrolysing)